MFFRAIDFKLVIRVDKSGNQFIDPKSSHRLNANLMYRLQCRLGIAI